MKKFYPFSVKPAHSSNQQRQQSTDKTMSVGKKQLKLSLGCSASKNGEKKNGEEGLIGKGVY